ncbi:MAG: glycosyltransferase [Planctomycetota bacterium]
MPRIVLLTPTLDASGAEKQLTLLATRLPGAGFEPHVVTLPRGGPYERTLAEAGVPVTHLGKKYRVDPWAFGRLRGLLRELRPDVLHTWMFTANGYGRLAATKGGPKVVVSERCVDSWKGRLRRGLDRALIGRTDLLVGNSRPVADFYEQLGYDGAKVRVVPNAVEAPDDASRTVEAKAAVRAELGLGDGPVIGTFGRLAAQKRVDELLWAMHLLKQVDPRVTLLVVGDGPERARLERLAAGWEVTPHSRFLGHVDDAARLWPACDVAWLASGFEGMSNSLMEAMAAGLPVVASDIPANRELVEEGVTGRIVPLGDSVAFTKTTRRLLEDPAAAAALGTAARARMRARYGVDAMAAAYAEIYREVLGGAQKPIATG